MSGARGTVAGIMFSLESERVHSIAWNPLFSSWTHNQPHRIPSGLFLLRKQILISVEQREKSNKGDTVERPQALESKDISFSPSSAFN